MKRSWIVVGTLMLLLAGCTDKEKASNSKPSTTETVSKQNSVVDKINAINLPETIEEFQQSPSGVFTKDFSFKKETDGWPDRTPMKDIEKPFKKEFQKLSKQTKDEDVLYKALVYYLGNSAYKEAVNKVISTDTSFDEPILPEPKQEESQAIMTKNKAPAKAMILLDASSSMLQNVNGKQRMGIAKGAVRSFAKTIGVKSDVSLFVYGHAGTDKDADKSLSCSKIEEVYPMQKYNEETFVKAVDQVHAKGWTPLAGAIKKAREASGAYTGEITVYIVSDGAETCDGDPVKEAKAFVQGSDKRKVNIIGFNVDQKSETELKKVAKAGNGHYLTANNAEEINQQMAKLWIPSDFDIFIKNIHSPKNSVVYLRRKVDIDQDSLKISRAIDVEHNRFQAAIELLKKEKIISEQQAVKLKEKIDARKETLSSLKKELNEEKIKELEDEADRIDRKIKDWSKRMKQLNATSK